MIDKVDQLIDTLCECITEMTKERLISEESIAENTKALAELISARASML